MSELGGLPLINAFNPTSLAASEANGQLFVSKNDNPDYKVQIAQVQEYYGTGPLQYFKYEKSYVLDYLLLRPEPH